jgi:Undecaprenyl-phosphate glucose phosphotransferase
MRTREVLQVNTALGFVLRVSDLLALTLGGILAYLWSFHDLAMRSEYRVPILIGLLLSLIIFSRFSLYRRWRGSSLPSEIWAVTVAWASLFFSLSALGYFIPHYQEIAVPWGLHWMFLSWILLCFFRTTLRATLNLMRTWGFNRRRIVLVVASELGLRIAERLKTAPWTGLDVVGYFDDRAKERLPDTKGIPLLGTVADLGAYSQKHRLDEVWLAFPFRAEERIKEVLHELRHCTTDIRMVPDIFQFRLLNYSMSEVAGMPVLNLTTSPIVGLGRFVKALEDRLLAALILLLVSPLMIIIAMGVKLGSPGPVFFKQRRHGWDGKPIIVWKFRTMRVHIEENGILTQATRDDHRVTRFGTFLRRSSLDELPQFFNVLQGTMSIVGPRPHAIEHNELFKESVNQYMLRHKVKPGITGWAQINGYRGETDTLEKMEKRIEYDLFYIENWSLWFDLRIIVATLTKGFVNKNAY